MFAVGVNISATKVSDAKQGLLVLLLSTTKISDAKAEDFDALASLCNGACFSAFVDTTTAAYRLSILTANPEQ